METKFLTFLFYGFAAAWVIVLLYVVSIARRSSRLEKELRELKALTAPSGDPEFEATKR